MRHLKRGRYLTHRRIYRILIQDEIADGDRQNRRFKFIAQSLEPDVMRKKIPVENDDELSFRRPVFLWLEQTKVIGGPTPGTVNVRPEVNAAERSSLEGFKPCGVIAEIYADRVDFAFLFPS